MDFDPAMTPAAFEAWCAMHLARTGWRSRAVGASGDQGADVIAERGRLRAVIQCKLYQSPVGNKAVQEAHAARAHHGADIAAVVASSSFTPSAKHLASTTGVLLLLHSEMDRFDDLVEALDGPQSP
jgi:restriction system protein